MKGGREDVNTPFWSWDIGLSGAFWPKWPRESLSPRKVTFSEINIFLRRFRLSEFFRTKARNIPMHIINENIFFIYLVANQSKPAFRKIYWNIFGHNFATGGPNNWFLAPFLKSKFKTPYFLKQLILTNHYQDFDPPSGGHQTRQCFFVVKKSRK